MAPPRGPDGVQKPGIEERPGWVEASDEEPLLAALRAGEEGAFATLVAHHHSSMVRLAIYFVGDPAVAEEVVQETWIGVLQSLERFEGRSSLKTWIFRIVANIARTRAKREGRSIAFSALGYDEMAEDERAVHPERFVSLDNFRGHWLVPPTPWGDVEESVAGTETLAFVRDTIETLPPTQRQVITMRDVEGWSSVEVCNVLDLTETNQRVLLHRARSKVRRALEQYLSQE